MIDETSLHILRILQQKARVPNVEVARQVNMAPSAVLERIRKLEKQGIIDGYEVILNPKRFNRDMVAFVRIFLETGSDPEVSAQALAQIPEIQEIHFITGSDSLLVKLRVSGTTALSEIISGRISALRYVTRTETAIALRTYKESSQIPLDSVDISDIDDNPPFTKE
jgi:Lrp/AsnC family leucine-responsive transcriptional regulator